MNDDRKVIPLNTKFKKQLVMTTPNDLRAAATGTIALLMFIMVGFNFSMFQVKPAEQAKYDQNVSRGIASVPKLIEPQWERSLANLSRGMIAQSGKKPTAIESLNFGYLEGRYSMNVEGGRIMQIKLSDDGAPRAMMDRLAFIQKYSGALAPGFKAAEKVRIEASQVGFKELYKVETAKGSKMFEFQIDDQDRLVSLDIK